MVIAESLLRAIIIIALTQCTWYGPEQTNGEPYVSSFWAEQLPLDAPSMVNFEYLGAASASRVIAFGTKVKLKVLGVPDWANEEYSGIIGNEVVVIIVDRLADEYGKVRFDLWPAAARRLMGEDYERIGIVYVSVEVINEENKLIYGSGGESTGSWRGAHITSHPRINMEDQNEQMYRLRKGDSR